MKKLQIRSLGICLGAATISVVVLEKSKSSRPIIIKHEQHPHEGHPRQTLLNILKNINMQTFDSMTATGRKFRGLVNLSSISEPRAVEYACDYVIPAGMQVPAVVCGGGETFLVYLLDSSHQISNVISGNKCASGTGEFFLQQLKRMNVTLEEASAFAVQSQPYPVSGRCSVFCKSDCTHAINKGIPKDQVTAGLCSMISTKILGLLKKVPRHQIMLTGGITRNLMLVNHLHQKISNLFIPEEAVYFEALGAALWGLKNKTRTFPGQKKLFKSEQAIYHFLPPLKKYSKMVFFKNLLQDQLRPGDECILGLDVGSTTTKAVLMRKKDQVLTASVYLRTNGNPIDAARRCYQSLLKQSNFISLKISGLGVCGSGRRIAGLHALTDGIINEISAHAAAAVYFDPQVDTIFEIGGQDAKYTYIVNQVPADYAMNEACSAGTGSFLEEAAYETLGIKLEKIATTAMQGLKPPNFNDQCAAFIGSDIKNAIHEGCLHTDIAAGLVYSICMNYCNRVKGHRPVGQKIFMQGGVCYNHAVPLAMAGLIGKPIIVPPEPGLMGAWGAALVVKERLEGGLLRPQEFNLKILAERRLTFTSDFICQVKQCGRQCKITNFKIEGRQYPFGGACNRYDNLPAHVSKAPDLVDLRQNLIFKKNTSDSNDRPVVGINRSFLVHTYYPLYAQFFNALNVRTILPQTLSQEGMQHCEAPFCYPGELAHGFFDALLKMPSLDYLFLPHFKAMPTLKAQTASQVCPLVQGEPFYLKTTFFQELKALKKNGTQILSPLLDMTTGIQAAGPAMLAMARQMGFGKKQSQQAFELAMGFQLKCFQEIKNKVTIFLENLRTTPEKFAVVLFARSYSGFASEANAGIPRKLASRGIGVIPLDGLPLEEAHIPPGMYWGMGQRILAAADLVAQDQQLFGVYITNFSCGPDSFLLTAFRDRMGSKPSLTLELDSHSADAGLETRIEAFVDIIAGYRSLNKTSKPSRVITSQGENLSMTNPRVTLLIPSMGPFSSQAVAACFRSIGFHAQALLPADEKVLKIGRANTSCKECLPLILTMGGLLDYIKNQQKPDEILVYFMPTTSGPCRFGQYQNFMETKIKNAGIPNVTFFSLSSADGYNSIGASSYLRIWWGFMIADLVEDIRSLLCVNACEQTSANAIFKEQWGSILFELEYGDFNAVERQLKIFAHKLKTIPLKKTVGEVPMIALVGEIFARRDPLSRQYLTEYLAGKGFAVTCAPISEWLLYTNYMAVKGFLKHHAMQYYAKRIKTCLAKSGLINAKPLKIKTILKTAAPYLSPQLEGEAILTIGGALTEIADHACGVISIGPFGCMPNRLSEAILKFAMQGLPFLAIESDGSAFPQMVYARLESFCLSAERQHKRQ